MGLFRPGRSRRGRDPWLPHKQLLFMLGALCAMLGIALDRVWLINLGIAILLVGVVLRFVGARDEPPNDE